MTVKETSLINIEPDFRVYLIRGVYLLTTGIFGRGFNFAMRNISRLMPNKKITLKLAENSHFIIDLNDFYWNRIVLKKYRYEPELEYALKLLKDIDYVLLDCGANIGYWSVLATSDTFGNKKAIAIEATAETFKLLEENKRANNNRFTVLNNAIYYEDDHEFTMSDAKHHAANEIEENICSNKPKVKSITIDSIVKKYNIEDETRVLIKLDVEGQEINALKGAANTLEYDSLFVYEDHGKETDHTVTQYIMNELGLNVFYIDTDCSVIKIKNVNELDAIKTSRGIGYNFFACKEKSVFNKKLQDLVL